MLWSIPSQPKGGHLNLSVVLGGKTAILTPKSKKFDFSSYIKKFLKINKKSFSQ